MHKVIKILVSTISALLLAAITIPVVAMLLLHIELVQNLAVRGVTSIISKKLQTTVSIDRISIKLINSVVLHGIYVEDYSGDTLLYSKKLEVGVNHLGIFGGAMSLGTVRLQGTQFNISQNSDGVTNLQQILAKIKSNKPKSDKVFSIKATALDLDSVRFTMRKYSPKEVPQGAINFQDLQLENLSAKLRNISLVGDSVHLRMRDFKVRDKSGFEVDSLACRDVAVSGRGIEIADLMLVTPKSTINAPIFNLRFDSWGDFKNFAKSVEIEATLTDSKINFQTLGYFVPKLAEWHSEYTNVGINVKGTIDQLSGEITSLQMNNTHLRAKFGLVGVTDFANARFNVTVRDFTSNISDIDMVAKEITGKNLSDKTPVLKNLGNVGFVGHFNGLLTDFKADGELTSDVGRVNLDVTMKKQATQTNFSGVVNAVSVNLGKLLSLPKFGTISASARVEGKSHGKDLLLDTKAEISQLNFNDYTYRNISINGEITNKKYVGLINSHDPNINFDFNGQLDFNDSIPRYDFDLDLHNADLAKLHFNTRDSISILRFSLIAKASGSTLNNINGVTNISSLEYINHTDSIKTGAMQLTAENNSDIRHLAFASSFADAQFKSRLDYGQMFVYLKSFLYEYVPALAKDKFMKIERQPDGVPQLDNYSLVTLKVKKANNIAGIFVPGLQIANGTQLTFLFNPKANQFSFTLSSDFIEKENFFASKINVSTQNRGDSLALFAGAEDLYVGGFYLPNLSILGGARDGKMNLSTKFSDPKKQLSVMLGLRAVLEKDQKTGRNQISMKFHASTFTLEDQIWRITANEILFDSSRLVVDNFRFVRSNQELAIDGVLSRSPKDTLGVYLRNFDLKPISQLTTRLGYSLSGTTNGQAHLVAAMKMESMTANISMDSVKINDMLLPPSLFEAQWDTRLNRAVFWAGLKNSTKHTVDGFFEPQTKKIQIDANFNGLNLALLDPLLTDVIQQTQGRADTKLKVTGTLKQLKINGEVDIHDFASTVSFTGVRYSLPAVKADVVDGVLTLHPTRLLDEKGNSGEFNLQLDARNFKNLIYSIDIKPRDLMVLNTKSGSSDFFYGTVYASGAATIKGDKRGVNMNIVAQTSDNSEFAMPLSNKSSISKADFIVFENPQKRDSLDYISQRKLMFEQKSKVLVKSKANLNIDMAINVRANTDFQLVIDPTVGDILKGRGNGDLNIHINPQNDEFSIYGDYVITSGSYLFTLQNVINKKFVITPGSSIKWTGDPINATLDIQAVYRLKASLRPMSMYIVGDPRSLDRKVPVNCEINLSDRLSEPTIGLNVAVPNVEPEVQAGIMNAMNTQEMMATQFFFLIAGGTFYAEQGANIGQSSSSTGGNAAASTGLEFLSNQVSNWISSDRYDIGIRYNQGSSESNISDKLEVGVGTSLAGNRLLLEMEGNFDVGGGGKDKIKDQNTFIGDFSLTWLIDRQGSLRTKVFSRTIDRFDENQGLQENGLGLYYKEDFDNGKDIVNNFKNRFKRKPKTEIEIEIEE